MATASTLPALLVSTETQGLPLEDVLDDLRRSAHSLDNELIEIINQDYADLINLSSNLVGIDKTIGEVRAPLSHIQKDVQVKKLFSSS